MKKISVVLAILLVFTLFPFSQPSHAASDIQLRINGSLVNLSSDIVVKNGRVLLPFALLGNQLGASPVWDGHDRMVLIKKDDRLIKLTIDSKEAQVDGKTVIMDEPATIINDRTMVPLRFVAESLLIDVRWDGQKRMVLVETKSPARVNLPFEVFKDTAEYPSFLSDYTILNAVNPFIKTVNQEGYSYVVLGYGEQPTGGYHVEVTNVYKNADNTIFVESTLVAPDPESVVTMGVTYTKGVLKFENKEKLPVKANLPEIYDPRYE